MPRVVAACACAAEVAEAGADAVATEDVGTAAGSTRPSDTVPAVDGGADFAQRPDVDAVPAAAAEVGAPARAAAPAVCDVAGAKEAAPAGKA